MTLEGAPAGEKSRGIDQRRRSPAESGAGTGQATRAAQPRLRGDEAQTCQQNTARPAFALRLRRDRP